MTNIFMSVQRPLSIENMQKVTKDLFKTFKGVTNTYDEVKEYLQSKGLNIENVYLDTTGLYPFWYIQGNVYIPLTTTDIELLSFLQLKERVEAHSEQLGKYWKKGNYGSFFALVEKQFTFELFFKLLNKIPKGKQYNVFRSLYTRNEYGFNELDKEKVRSIIIPNKGKVPKYKLETDKDGYVTIFRGMQSLSTRPYEAYSWTTNLSVAMMFATRYKGEIGDIYKAKIHYKDVVDYLYGRNEYEILVIPEDLVDIQKTDYLLYNSNFKNEIEYAGIVDEYNHLNSSYIKEEYYHNPKGIHGVNHIRRVLLLSLIMTYLEDLSEQDRLILSFASLYHDIGRTCDGVDDYHGLKSVNKMRELNLYLPLLTEDEKNILEFIMVYHAMADKKGIERLTEIENIKDKERALNLFKRFKDCDNLDRVRLRDLNEKYIRTSTGKSMHTVAIQIYNEIY